MPVPGALTAAEIDERPAVMARILGKEQHSVAAIRAYDPAFVLVAARGSSDHAAVLITLNPPGARPSAC